MGIFNINLFCMVVIVNILCSHAFSTIIGIFYPGMFMYIITGARKKVLENKVTNWEEFISRIFEKRTFFHRTFLVLNIRTFFRKLFSKNFLGGYQSIKFLESGSLKIDEPLICIQEVKNMKFFHFFLKISEYLKKYQ